MKNELTIEQSQHLIDLGVDPKLASKDTFLVADSHRSEYFDEIERLTGKRAFPKGVFQKSERRYVGGPVNWNIYHKIFTLTDILTILPKEIGNYELNISATKDEYFVSYILWDSGTDDYGYIRDVLQGDQISAPELIDSLYQLLCYCLEQGYVKLKTDNQ